MFSVGALNITLGQVATTTNLLIHAIEKSAAMGNRLLVLPALATTGCHLGDRFLRDETYEQAESVLEAILPYTKEITVILGTILRFDGKFYQVAAVLHKGRVVAYVPKSYADGPDEDDRYFARFDSLPSLTPDNIPFGPWRAALPGLENLIVHIGAIETLNCAPTGAIIAHVAAAPYYLGHYGELCHNLCAFSELYHITILHAAMLGCSDGTHIADGSTLYVTDGKIIARGKRFVFADDFVITDETQSSSDETSALPEKCSSVDGIFEELLIALSLGMRDYLRRAHISKICLALSGGRDSALCALIVWRMVQLSHPDADAETIKNIVHDLLICAYLPTENSSSLTRKAALDFAAELGAGCAVIPIQSQVSELNKTMRDASGIDLSWNNPQLDLTMQNMQARIRSVVIWTLANANDALLLTTSNMSEAAVGYATMDGDTSGGLAPIANLPKTLVSQLLLWARKRFNIKSLDDIFAMPPSAELRPLSSKQEDEKDLMPYDVLDALIYAYVVDLRSPEEIISHLWDSLCQYYEQREDFEKDVRRFIKMMAHSQWKRERYANGFIVMNHDLSPNAGLRWPVLFG